MNKRKKNTGSRIKSASLEVASTANDLVFGAIEFVIQYFYTLWLLAFRRKFFAELLVNKNEERKMVTLPFTFLLISSLLAAIYFRALADSFFGIHINDLHMNYRSLMENIVKHSSIDFKMTTIIIRSLPILVVVSLLGMLLSKIYDKTGAPRYVLFGASYAFGFALLLLVIIGLAPLVLKPIFYNDMTLWEMDRKLPLWLKIVTLLFLLYSYCSIPHIVGRVIERVSKPNNIFLRYVSLFLVGIFGIQFSMNIIIKIDKFEPFTVIGLTKKQPASPSDDGLLCSGRLIYVDKNKTFEWSFLLYNESKDNVNLFTSPIIMILEENYENMPTDDERYEEEEIIRLRESRIEFENVEWEDSPLPVMTIPTKNKIWINIKAKVSDSLLGRIYSIDNSEKKKKQYVIANTIYFKGIERDFECSLAVDNNKSIKMRLLPLPKMFETSGIGF